MPIMNMSLLTANFWFNVSNIALLVGAVIVAIGTYGVYKTGAIKERFADERISFNEGETEKAKSSAAKADENAQIVKRSNLVLQTELERERTARLKLESKLAPRHLSAEDMKAIVEAIKPYAGQKVDVFVPLGDTEAKVYAADFVKSFRDAGWNAGANDGISQAAYIGTPRGLILQVSQADASSPPASVIHLGEALRSLGLLRDGESDPQLAAGGIRLIVGSKPD